MRNDVPVMIVQDVRDPPVFVLPLDGLLLPAGHGMYTCCMRNHDFGKGPGTGDCDRHSVGPVISGMIDTKVEHLFNLGKMYDARLLAALKSWLMRGLPSTQAADRKGDSGDDTKEGEDDEGGESKTMARTTRASSDARLASTCSSGLAAARELFRWRDDATEAKETARSGVGLLFWCSMQDNVKAVLELAEQSRHGGKNESNSSTRIHRPDLFGIFVKGACVPRRTLRHASHVSLLHALRTKSTCSVATPPLAHHSFLFERTF